MKRDLVAVLSLAVAVALVPHRGAAQGVLPGERARVVRVACAVDHQRFCRDVRPGGGRILRCLSRHAELVSQPCFQALTAWGLASVNAFKMCMPDAAALCRGVPPRFALACLQGNADKLSSACRSSLTDLDLLNGANGTNGANGGGAPKRP